MRRRRFPWLVAVAAVALLAAACLPPAPAPPPPPPPLPAAPGGTSVSGLSIEYPEDSFVGDFPDPFVLGVDGQYYAYSTGSLVTFSTVQVMTSPDLVHWTYVGDAFAGPTESAVTPPPNKWAGDSTGSIFGSTWGPAVLQIPANPAGEQFVMYYAAKSRLAGATNGQHCIGRAFSASPEGPFVDSSDFPIYCAPGHGGWIDPEPFANGGSLYLLMKSEGIAGSEPTRLWSASLSADGRGLGDVHELLSTAAGSWEEPIVESPSMMPAPGGGFLLFYSASRWETTGYSVGVAYCATPTSACSRIYSTPVLATRGAMTGTGGEHVFQDLDGNWRVAFASWTSPYVGYVNIPGWPFDSPDTRYARSLHILPLGFPSGHNPSIG